MAQLTRLNATTTVNGARVHCQRAKVFKHCSEDSIQKMYVSSERPIAGFFHMVHLQIAFLFPFSVTEQHSVRAASRPSKHSAFLAGAGTNAGKQTVRSWRVCRVPLCYRLHQDVGQWFPPLCGRWCVGASDSLSGLHRYFSHMHFCGIVRHCFCFHL